MAAVNDKVLTMVRDEIEKNPKVTTSELYDRAKKIDKEVGKLSARQFNARYPLQVKRRMAPPPKRRGRGRSRKQAAQGGDRTAVRAVLQQLAQDVAGAESGAELVTVVGNLDNYVDQVLKASGGSR